MQTQIGSIEGVWKVGEGRVEYGREIGVGVDYVICLSETHFQQQPGLH